ncbi:MAG: heme ABC exporter ATP-binding protein CcmA [Gemmatimonas sp.]
MTQLSATALACRRGDRLVFTGLDLTLRSGGALIAVGANGSGKSSLLRLLAGLLAPFAGVIAWDGVPVTRDTHAHRRRVAYLGHADAVKPALTVAEDIRFWTALDGGSRQAGDAALAAMGLAPLAELSCRHLSAGQKRRLALARVLARIDAPLWILDEPTNGLDSEARRRLARALAAHRDGGGMVVAATHEDLALPGAVTLDLSPFAVEARAADVRGLEVDRVV